MTNFLQRIGSKTITYDNSFPQINRVLIMQRQINYVEDITVTRDTSNLGMSGREAIKTIPEKGEVTFNVQVENHLD